MKPLTRARHALARHMFRYYSGCTVKHDDKSTGYIILRDSVDKVYFKIELNSDDTKAKVKFQFAPIDPLILDI